MYVIRTVKSPIFVGSSTEDIKIILVSELRLENDLKKEGFTYFKTRFIL